MIDIVNALTGDVLTSVDLDETVEVLPQLRVHFWQEFCRPPFSVAFTSGHNMLHDSAVLRDIDPMNGIAAALLPIVSSWARDLEEAVRCNNPHETMTILKRGQDPNALVLNVDDGRLESPLVVGLKRNSAAAVQVLLQGRADPNLATGRRRPLFFAVECADPSSTDLLDLLLRHGANPNIADAFTSPIELASMKSQVDMVKLLLHAGANPLQVGMEWDNAFISAEPEGSTLRLIMDSCWGRITAQDIIFRHFSILDDFVPSQDIRFASKGCYFQVAYYHPLPLARRLCLSLDAYGGSCPFKHENEARFFLFQLMTADVLILFSLYGKVLLVLVWTLVYYNIWLTEITLCIIRVKL